MKGEEIELSARFGLIEKAVYMKLDGHTPAAIMKSLQVARSTYQRWRASDDWKDIEIDVRQSQCDEAKAIWRRELNTAVRMVKRMADEGDPNNPVYIEAVKFIVESQGLGPKGETSDKEIPVGPSPVAIQIIQGSQEAAQLTGELRQRLGSPDASVDSGKE